MRSICHSESRICCADILTLDSLGDFAVAFLCLLKYEFGRLCRLLIAPVGHEDLIGAHPPIRGGPPRNNISSCLSKLSIVDFCAFDVKCLSASSMHSASRRWISR